MDPFAVSHFSDNALLHDLKTLVAQDCRTTGVLLTRIAEVDERQLFRREGYSSMHEYCLHELHFSEGVTYKRINAARAAREYPAVLMAVVEGRLHLSGVLALAPRRRPGNADELVAAATHKTRAEIELLIAERFPRPDLPERLQAIPAPAWATLPAPPPQDDQLAPGQVDASTISPAPPALAPLGPLSPGTVDASSIAPGPAAEGHVCRPSPGHGATSAPRPRMIPLAPGRFGLQFTLDREAYDLLEEARALEGRRNPTGEILAAFKNALRCYVGELRKQKFAATEHPRPSHPGSSARHIPAAVKRAVRERDGERCTFVSVAGRRCPARRMLEFDHREPVARGGESTVENLRLVCRAHNQYSAECTFGRNFMNDKRAVARARAAT